MWVWDAQWQPNHLYYQKEEAFRSMNKAEEYFERHALVAYDGQHTSDRIWQLQ